MSFFIAILLLLAWLPPGTASGQLPNLADKQEELRAEVYGEARRPAGCWTWQFPDNQGLVWALGSCLLLLASESNARGQGTAGPEDSGQSRHPQTEPWLLLLCPGTWSPDRCPPESKAEMAVCKAPVHARVVPQLGESIELPHSGRDSDKVGSGMEGHPVFSGDLGAARDAQRIESDERVPSEQRVVEVCDQREAHARSARALV